MLEGREEELAWLATRLAALREHRPFAALLRGEAGVGKSSLIDAAVRDAQGVRVLRARGYESDREIPFAGLLELAAPLLDLRERLPEAQRDAVEAAFALRRPEPHDRFAVPAGLLGLLSNAAEDEPLVAVVDDVHWLDDASRDALLFVARRLAGEPIGVLMGLRDGAVTGLDFSGIEELALQGLDEASSLRLLRRDSPDLPERVAGALVVATAGNPLALQEVPAALTAGQRAGTDALADPLPTTAAVEEAFARQIAALPGEAGGALTVAAAMSRIDLDELLPALYGSGWTRAHWGRPSRRAWSRPPGPAGSPFATRCYAPRRSTPPPGSNSAMPTRRWPTRRAIPAGGRGTWRTRQCRRTKRWRAPWRTRPTMRAAAAATRRPPGPSPARPSCPPFPRHGAGARWRPHRTRR